MIFKDLASECDNILCESLSPELLAVVLAYEAWEAKLILDDRSWHADNGIPQMTEEQFDQLLEIQNMRNAAKTKAGVT